MKRSGCELVLREPLEQCAGQVEIQQACRPDGLRAEVVPVVQLVAIPVQLLEDPGFRRPDTAPVPDKVNARVEIPRELPADVFRHDLLLHLVVVAARSGVAGVAGQDLVPAVAYALQEHVAGQFHLGVAAHDHLGCVVQEDERQAGVADRSPVEEVPGLIQLDRRHLQAFQVIQAQSLAAIDEIVFHPPSRLRHRFPRCRR